MQAAMVMRWLPGAIRIASWAGVVSAVLLSAGGVQAQDQRPTMGALLDDGFEVRSTTLIPAAAASRISQTADPDSLLITMQKGPRLAFCYVTYNSIFGEGPYTNRCYVRK